MKNIFLESTYIAPFFFINLEPYLLWDCSFLVVGFVGTVSGGCRKRSKPKFSFGSHSCNKDLIVTDRHGKTPSNNITSPGEIDATVDEDMDEFMAESKLDIHDNKSEKPENHIVPFELAYKHDFKEHSVADFLHCFQARSEMLEGNSEMVGFFSLYFLFFSSSAC